MREPRRVAMLELLDDEVPNAIRAGAAPVFFGDAGIDYLCGMCGSELCLGMRDGALAGMVFVCSCGATNLVPVSACPDGPTLAAAGT
jgi:hypothetical protein